MKKFFGLLVLTSAVFVGVNARAKHTSADYLEGCALSTASVDVQNAIKQICADISKFQNKLNSWYQPTMWTTDKYIQDEILRILGLSVPKNYLFSVEEVAALLEVPMGLQQTIIEKIAEIHALLAKEDALDGDGISGGKMNNYARNQLQS